MSDALTLSAVAIGSGGLTGVIIEVVRSWRAGRDKNVDLEKHRDNLTFDLIEAARTEVRVLRDEVARLRPLENHLLHFEEALMHVERLLIVPPDSENRGQIEREARAFLTRIQRIGEAVGIIRNEAQRTESMARVAEADRRDRDSK